MSTRCRIGILEENENVRSIYCHFDGYYDGVGRILNDNYKGVNKIKELIDLGSISSLGKDVNPPDELNHSFEYPLPGVVVAYHRDRGEKKIEAKLDDTLDDFFETCNDSNAEYCYLYDEKNQEWLCSSYDGFESGKLEKLQDVMDDIDFELKDNNGIELGGIK